MFDFTNVKEVRLSRGAHDSPEKGMCFMEMTAWFAGEKHSDKPACVSPALGHLGIAINDSMGDQERDEKLKPIIPHVVGTFDDAAEAARIEYICLRAFNYAVGFIAPEFVRKCGKVRSFGSIRNALRHLQEYERYAHMDRYRGDLSLAMKYATSSPHDPCRRTLLDHLMHMTEMRLPFPIRPYLEEEKACKVEYAFPGLDNAKAAAAVFSIMGDFVPDWSAAIDTLREAIKLGRCDGFDASVSLVARHKSLRELVEA